jgi:two-component system, sensor histidine kinase and response regulator
VTTKTAPADPQGAEPGRPSLEEVVALRTAELAAAKDAAEAALAAKSAFLARMSHEIRTPMNTIIGLNHIMLRDVAEPRLRQQIDKVLGAAEQLLGLIDDVLDLSRLEAGQVTLAHGDFSPRQVVEGVCALVASQLDGKGLELRVEIAPAVPRTLRGDANRLRQLLLNFATNAAKFTERGHVRFGVSCTARAGEERVWMCFEVGDTGIGMTTEQAARAFHAFEQGDGGVARRYGGTGLGLALCQRLAQLMGGRVSVKSEAGRGSTFSFEAPFERGVGASTPESSDAQPDTGSHRALDPEVSRRVLLVDDNLLNLEVADALLRMDGYDVEVAHDGVEAVERARERGYAAILIDVQMPRMDGLEATRRIRQVRRHAATPIIAMTASAFEEDRRVCREAGMNELVAKPVEPSHLSRVMARWAPLPTPEGAAKDTVEHSAGSPAPAPVAPPLVAGRDRLQLLELQRLVEADDFTVREYFRTLPRHVTEPLHAELAAALEAFDHERAGTLLASLLRPPRAQP